LARSFRYYGKKRGHRRTGSPALGSVGEAALWAALLFLGCGGLVLMIFSFVVPEWRVNHEFSATTCKVLDKRVGEKQSEDGPLYRPEIRIEYDVDGTTYRDWHYDIHRAYSSGREAAQAVVDEFNVYDKAKDNRYPCWYDPSSPDVAVLECGYRWWMWLVFTVPASFMVIGGGGLIYTLLRWGKSAERRALLAQRVQERDFFGAGGQRTFPFVPEGADMTNSPGTTLRFRLPMGASPGWATFGLLALCILWNGFVAVLVAIAVSGYVAGQPDWLLTIFVVPFVAVGLATIGIILRRLVVASRIGPTLMEVSDHPLQPGGQYRLFLSQSGRLTVKALRVWLKCEEAATYRQGTNTRTETREVYCQECFSRKNFTIASGLPFETEIELSVPEAAMHSFKAEHNEISWSMAIDSEVVGWPSFKRLFPIIVQPANGSADP
jgi:hypothetical protein